MPNEISELHEYIVPFYENAVDVLFEDRPDELVRCGDCKYFCHDNFGRGEEYWCTHFVDTHAETEGLLVVDEDNYCAWAERKEPERLVMPPSDGSVIPGDYLERRSEDEL